MNTQPKAYNELMNRILPHEDRAKLEWVIGSMLSSGPEQTVIFFGPVRSGKTTMMRIIQKLLVQTITGNGARVVFQQSGYSPLEFPHTVGQPCFIFAETHEPVSPPEAIFLQTTGDRLPVHKYHVLMTQIDSELDDIAEHCINIYRNGPQAVRITQENI